MPDHSKWANKQVQAAIELGINPLDAANAVRAFLDLLPPGADPATYTLPAQAMEQDITAPELLQDATAAWVGREDVPTRFKLLLLAGGE
jgi:hypothetical protein